MIDYCPKQPQRVKNKILFDKKMFTICVESIARGMFGPDWIRLFFVEVNVVGIRYLV